MSFLRHGEIFRSDAGFGNAGSSEACLPPALIGLDEFPVGYFLGGLLSSRGRLRFANRATVCSTLVLPVEECSSNGELCLNWLSHPRGQAHT
jgi:hypothetical protein